MLLAVDVGGTPLVAWAPAVPPGGLQGVGGPKKTEAAGEGGAAQDGRGQRYRDASADAGSGALTDEQRAMIDKLKARDREVRDHEEAHASVGGQYAGSPSYTYQQGPDGQNYAIGGEVPIDVAPVDGDPEATIEKMTIVERAALAPAEPSPQDMRVASEARARAAEASAELLSGPPPAEGGDDAAPGERAGGGSGESGPRGAAGAPGAPASEEAARAAAARFAYDVGQLAQASQPAPTRAFAA